MSKVYLATLQGSDFMDSLVTAFSLGNPGVHSEIWITGFRSNFRVSTFHPKGRCVAVRPFSSEILDWGWHVVEIPVTNVGLAVQFVEEAVRSNAHYSISLPEIMMPRMLLDELDPDLDCMRPNTWDRLFCSQFALLFLRRCALAGVLGGGGSTLSMEKWRLLWGVSSKGCLPSRLQIIADRVFSSKCV